MRSREQVGQQGQAMPSIVAVVSVVAIVVAMVAFLAAGGDDTAAEPQAERETTSPPASTTPTTTASPQGPQTAAQAPPREQADRADRKQDKKPKAKPRQQRQQRAAPESSAPDVYVEVYNNTSISGLAAQRAAELQDAGWQVIGVDNWFGDIPASTVYYPAGFEAEADALAETLGVDRVRGAVAPMKFDRLTVILTPDAT
ncbi:MAG TPA: LytR C-terminal domain-containing protein [Nocardioidaceae bacterium]|nr:LytR C-terminal domain-containing protein [Nocardioidaceae bacterium]